MLQARLSGIVITLCMTVVVAGSNGFAQDVAPSGAAPVKTSVPATQPASDGPAVETVVIFRHGEKPTEGLGQLTPQGLNRALALSVVLPEKFGRPDYLFAPDPREKTSDRGGLFNYCRPLATMEPIAIRLGLPIQTPCGFKDIEELEDELSKPQYAHAMVFVSWEHLYAQRAAAALFKRFGGNPSEVPSWPGTDYDSLYVLKIRRSPGEPTTATFTHEHEGLDGQSTVMPTPAAK
ncbi:MAG TPA: hypothetical protein VGI81_14245 [Tepidisphaeraceae bacterium]